LYALPIGTVWELWVSLVTLYNPEVFLRYSHTGATETPITLGKEKTVPPTCNEQQLSNLCSKVVVRAGYPGAGRRVRSLAGRLYITITKSANH